MFEIWRHDRSLIQSMFNSHNIEVSKMLIQTNFLKASWPESVTFWDESASTWIKVIYFEH